MRFITKAATTASVLTLCLAGGAHAQISINALATDAQGNRVYTQNFDTLLSTGNTNPISVIPGLVSNQTTYMAGTGSSSTGGLYSFGVAGVNPATDRALGSIPTNALGDIIYGFQFTNNTGATINNLTISYTGEQYRRGGNTTAPTPPERLQLSYAVNPTSVTSGTYTTVPSLDFNSPQYGAAGALDGNATANRTAIAATAFNITGGLADGQTLIIRFTDANDAGSDNGLAVDDFSVTFAAVPEPSSVVFGLMGAGMGSVQFLRVRYRRRNSKATIAA